MMQIKSNKYSTTHRPSREMEILYWGAAEADRRWGHRSPVCHVIMITRATWPWLHELRDHGYTSYVIMVTQVTWLRDHGCTIMVGGARRSTPLHWSRTSVLSSHTYILSARTSIRHTRDSSILVTDVYSFVLPVTPVYSFQQSKVAGLEQKFNAWTNFAGMLLLFINTWIIACSVGCCAMVPILWITTDDGGDCKQYVKICTIEFLIDFIMNNSRLVLGCR